MTQKEITRRFTVWCNRMLVSGAWKFTLCWDETADEIDGDAQIKLHRNYRHGTLTFASDQYKSWSPAYADEVIVHELMHTFTQPLSVVARELAENNLGGAAEDLALTWIRREDEFCVDHVAKVIINGYGPA